MELTAQKREKLGKSTKYIKREGSIPSAIFGPGMDSMNISLNYIDFLRVFKETGETELINLKTDGKTLKVLVKDVQYDPVTDEIIHVGFYKPDLTQKINAQVPVEIVGEEDNKLIENNTALVMILMQEITVEALPEDLPHAFTVDVSKMNEFGQGVKVGELEYDREKVTVPDLDPEDYVVRLDEIIIEEEPEEEITEEEALANLEASEETAEGEESEDSEDTKVSSSEE
jgi:large subunit ribosomal protein L25